MLKEHLGEVRVERMRGDPAGTEAPISTGPSPSAAVERGRFLEVDLGGHWRAHISQTIKSL